MPCDTMYNEANIAKGACFAMPTCPSCHQEFQVETPYCPACGAPMTQETILREKRAAETAALLPMKWHKFLIYFSVPVSLLMLAYSLVDTISMLSTLDPADFRPEALPVLRASLYLTIAVCALSIPLCVLIEYNLVKMRWRGVQLLMANYVLQLACGVATIVMLTSLGGETLSLFVSAATQLVMMLLVRVYYRKRRVMFR